MPKEKLRGGKWNGPQNWRDVTSIDWSLNFWFLAPRFFPLSVFVTQKKPLKPRCQKEFEGRKQMGQKTDVSSHRLIECSLNFWFLTPQLFPFGMTLSSPPTFPKNSKPRCQKELERGKKWVKNWRVVTSIDGLVVKLFSVFGTSVCSYFLVWLCPQDNPK